MGDMPSILLPLMLRKSTKFRSLRKHRFTSAEKTWVCRTILDHCNDIDVDLVPSIRSFSRQYDISFKSVGQWFDIYANGDQ